MNISKFIAKFVLPFFVFSSISVQGPVFALGGQPDVSVEKKNDLPDQYAQVNPLVRELRARDLRKRSKWKNMFAWAGYLALSAFCLYSCHAFPDHPKRTELAACGVFCGLVGSFGMGDFLKARVWGR